MSKTSKTWRHGLCGAIVVALALSFSGAAAQPDRKATRQARKLFYKGNKQYRLGNFDKALELFQQSLEQANRPNTVFNIAQCYRQLKQPDKALFNYKLYLSEWERLKPGTNPPHLAEVKTHIADLEAELEQAREEQRRREEAARKERERKERAQREAEQERARAAVAPEPAPAPKKETGTPFYKKWWVWTIAAAVVGGSVTAVLLTTGGDDRVAGGKDGRFDASNF